jgi:myxalamid-type polyketide synthase MxaB
VAIIGMGCRFPGADGPAAFWRLLCDRVDAITEVPPSRWDVGRLYDPNPSAPGKMSTRWGGFVEGIDRFDAAFFGISPREAAHMDPQQRLLLEVTWEALEDAGVAADALAGRRTGVFVGVGGSDYAQLHLDVAGLDGIDAYTGTGNALSVAANRVSHFFDLRGPSVAVDTACSSSLVALHLACESLRSGDSTLAVAGGVNVLLSPAATIAFSKARMMAADGRCKTFDAAADGYVRSEGCGVVVLKRLRDARRDGDTILAIVRGSSVNQDGRTAGIAAPNGRAQEAVLRGALAAAAIEPSAVGYVETHGTGTAVGDPTEVQALARVLDDGGVGEPCVLGSVKANIGHLETAAGIASVVKVVLCLRHEEIPGQLHFRTLNPAIAIDGTRLVIPTERRPWPRSRRARIAGVSAFGFGGTNAHVVIEEAPAPTARPRGRARERPLHVLALSAKASATVAPLLDRYVELFRTAPTLPFADVCFSANTGRVRFAHRVAVVAGSTADARDALAAARDDRAASGVHRGRQTRSQRPTLAFLFTGQGAQYAGMARQLYETHPAFRETIDRASALLTSWFDVPLLDIVYATDGSLIDRTAYAQPALFALEYALAELWRAWGVTPDVVLGHSVGEYAAACVAGAMSFEDGLAIVAERGRLMQAVEPPGTMVALFADEARVAAALARIGGRASIAAVNGPNDTVISGDADALAAVVRALDADGIRAKPLTVSHAFHSPLMEPVLEPFARVVSGVAARPLRVPLVSNLSGAVCDAGTELDAAYWRRHVREPVQFARGMRALAERGVDIFLEIGPSPVLLALGRACIADPGRAWLPSLRRGQDDWRVLANTAASLFVEGVDVDWAGFDQPYRRRRVALPTYPFERRQHWIHAEAPRETVRGTEPASHPLLGTRLRSPIPTFAVDVDLRRQPWLGDHRIDGVCVFPASAYLVMALAGGAEIFGAGAVDVGDVRFDKALAVGDDGATPVQLLVEPHGARSARFRVFGGTDGETASWVLHATGTLRDITATIGPARESLTDIRARCTDEMAGETLYDALAEAGLQYGPAFRAVRRVWRGRGEALGELAPVAALMTDGRSDVVHPVVLDAAFHVLAGALPQDGSTTIADAGYVPTGISETCACMVPSARTNMMLLPPAPRAFHSFSSNVRRSGTKFVSHMCRPGRIGRNVPSPR